MRKRAGDVSRQPQKQRKKSPGKDGRYVRRETFSGTCARSFYVGDQIKKEDIHAKFEDGVLKITLPRAEARKELPKANPNLIDIE